MKFVLFATVFFCCYMEYIQGSCLSYGHSCWGAHGKRANGPPRQLGRWALVKIVPDKNTDNNPRHISTDSQANEDSASIFDNPSFAFTDDESQQQQQHDENNNKQVDGMKPSLRRSYATDPDEDFSANDINVVGDDLLDARNMRYYKIRNPSIKKLLS
ncbi:uncharacterized protein LOC119067431 [Bradysia coprophila]|uniref:uncharacterized protein LOC119067431 n=1 Tax=Bradysia coprophila TaxID=38358 RepID=UPI00187D96F7|nr:uncharacterized protein LOC119067431 [Bradysia coprophila]